MESIEFVKGMLITPDGTKHPFGKHSYEPVANLTDENYHDLAFDAEILPQPWFRQLQQVLGFEYTNDTIHRQASKMAGKGILVLLNSSIANQEGEYNVFCIHSPQTLSDEQKQVLENAYPAFKEMLERKKAYFEADAYDESGNYFWRDFVYSVDDFYDRMSLNRENRKQNGR